MSLGWGYIPMQPAPQAAVAVPEDNIEVIQLVTNRASAPSLGEFLAELHNSETLSDITICSEDGQAIKCHKLVLIRWSAPFRRMLCGDMREAREKLITLHGVDGEVLAAFIRFLYTCHCSISPEKLVGLCAMADQYDVTLLQQLCMDAIRLHASSHRCCCLFYKAAKEIQQPEIQQLAWQQLSSNLHSLVQQHDVFVQLEFEDVLRLFSRHGPEADDEVPWAPAEPSSAGASALSGAAAAAAAATAPEAAAGERSGPSTAAASGSGQHLPQWVVLSGSPPFPAAGAAAAGGGAAGGAAGRLEPASVSGPARLVGPDGGRAQRSMANAMPLVLLGDEQPGEPDLEQQQPAASAQQGSQQGLQGYSRHDIALAYQQAGRPQHTLQQPRRPEYALFLACMAWLHHSPERQQYKQQLYECFDFGAMRDSELSQMRRNPYVQADPDLKELLLDAFEGRCLAHAQQPVYHMGPLPRASSGWERAAW